MYRHSGYNYVGIPAFTDYKNIKAHYESIAPIRGRKEECRPLGRRRYDWYSIHEKEVVVNLSPENPLGSFAKAYCARVYSTDCVEWLPNEDIIIRVPTWRGPTSMGILTYALAQHGTIVSASGKWYFKNKEGVEYLLPKAKGESVTISKGQDGVYRAAQVVKEYRYKAKRREMNRVRKWYMDFINYGKNMLAIDNKLARDHKLNDELCREISMASFNLTGTWGHAQENRSKLLQKVITAQATQDLDAMYKLATYCGITFGRYGWSNHYECTPTAFVRGMNELIKYVHHEELFEAVEVEQGKAFIDRNAKYVEQ